MGLLDSKKKLGKFVGNAGEAEIYYPAVGTKMTWVPDRDRRFAEELAKKKEKEEKCG